MRAIALVLLIGFSGAVAGCGKPQTAQTPPDSGKKADSQARPENRTPKNGATPRVGNSDQERLQGVWAVEKYDAGNLITAPPSAVLKTMRYAFAGNKLRHYGEYRGKKYEENYSFALAGDSNPKGMNVTRLGEDGKPTHGTDSDTEQWIYKLDGDHLILAIGDAKKRPTDFIPKPSSGPRPGTSGEETSKKEPYVPAIDVIRLKKTTESAPAPNP